MLPGLNSDCGEDISAHITETDPLRPWGQPKLCVTPAAAVLAYRAGDVSVLAAHTFLQYLSLDDCSELTGETDGHLMFCLVHWCSG